MYDQTQTTPPTGSPIYQDHPSFDRGDSVDQKQHVHNSYIWLSTIRIFFIFTFVSLISTAGSIAPLFFDDDPEAALATTITLICVVAFLIAVLIVVFLFHLVSYKHLYFIIGNEEFNLYSGVITKKRVHVPYDRIQSIDSKADLLQRIFGIRSIYIDTAGGSSNKAIIVPYLTKAQADWLTSELYSRKQSALKATRPSAQEHASENNILDIGKEAWDSVGGVFANESAPQQPIFAQPSFELGLSNKELIFAGISNNTTFVFLLIAFVATISQVFDLISEVFPYEADIMVDRFTSSMSDPLMIWGSAFIIGAVLLGLFVAWVIALVGSCIQLGGFRARRIENRVEVEHGLLQHTKQSIGIDRIQAVVVKQSAIRRLIGYCEISLDKIDAHSASDDQQKNNIMKGVVVHPFCKLSDVDRIVNGLVPEYSDVPDGMIKLPKVSFRRSIIRNCIWQGGGFWLAVGAFVLQILLNSVFNIENSTEMFAMDAEDLLALTWMNAALYLMYGVALVIFVIDLISAILWSRESGFATNYRFMKVVNGGLSKVERSFARNKIQFGYTKTNPLQRHSKVATIVARTAAGIGGTSIDLKDVSLDDANSWLAWVEPRVHSAAYERS